MDHDDGREQRQLARERRTDAKRKRLVFLDHLLRELDTVVLVELVTLYHLDCSFFWFAVRAIVHVTLLTPLPDLQLARQHEEHKAFLPLILVTFAANFILHLVCSKPTAGEETRGYLHGGLAIDFIGQLGPSSKWKLGALDMCILVLQLVMVSVLVKKRRLKKNLANIAGPAANAAPTGGEASTGEGADADGPAPADRDQDPDAEERGILRRTDSMSDTDAPSGEEDALLSTNSPETGLVDALDMLSSGQSVVGDFTLIDTLLQEHADYQVHRQTRAEAVPSAGLSPGALRQLHAIRVRFGVGGG